MIAPITHFARTVAHFTLALLRDRQVVFWNFGFFTILLVILLGVLSRGDVALKVTLTSAVVTLAVAANALFSVGVGVTSAREQGVFRRFAVTPLPRWIAVGAFVGARAAVVFAAAVMLVVIARTLFGVPWSGSALSVVVLLAFGTGACAAVGLGVSAIASAPHVANALVNLVLIPMVAIGGTTLPIAMLPSALGDVARWLPIAVLMSGLNDAFVAGAGLSDLASHYGILAAWTCGGGGIAALRWERQL